MTGRYRETAPDPALADAVACVWSFEGIDRGPQAIAPDGCCELIVHWAAPYEEENADGSWRLQGPALFAGQLTRPLRLRAPQPAGVVGVRFRPAGARPFCGTPLDRFTDRRVALGQIVGELEAAALVDAVRKAADADGRVRAAEAFVIARIRTVGRAPDPAVQRCVDAIAESHGRVSMNELERLSGLAARRLQRRFATEVGVSPRLLASVVRFRRVFVALQDHTTANWSAAAQAAGYFDHPQLARDFRRFVGATPTGYLAAREGLAAGLVDLAAS